MITSPLLICALFVSASFWLLPAVFGGVCVITQAHAAHAAGAQGSRGWQVHV